MSTRADTIINMLADMVVIAIGYVVNTITAINIFAPYSWILICVTVFFIFRQGFGINNNTMR